MIALVATEGAVITQVDRGPRARREYRRKEDEEDYEHIGGSTLTIAVTGAMMLLGELAGRAREGDLGGRQGLVQCRR